MSSSFRRRWIATVSVPFVALAGTSLAVPANAAAANGRAIDPRPARIGAAWLAGELQGGLLKGQFLDSEGNAVEFADYGLSIDAAFALAAVDRRPKAVAAITKAIAKNVDSYTTGADFGTPEDVYAGATAKTLALATDRGRNPRRFGGVDLVARMESLVLRGAPVAGRIQDRSAFGDFANVIGQGFAARGLTAVGSARANKATRFLLRQQCDAGWFRLDFTKSLTADQTCDGRAKSVPDADATALSVLALIEVSKDPGASRRVDRAIKAAASWLHDQQRSNGSLGGGTSTEKPNTNSTGLAGWVFGETGRTTAAKRAATWVRARQADEVAPCTSALVDETGAIAYDKAAVRTGRADGITEGTTDQWRRATTQALPALAWSPAGGTASMSAPTRFVKAGSRPRVTVSDVAPGATVCVTGGKTVRATHANRAGNASVRVLMPTRTTSVTIRAKGAGGLLAKATIDVLAGSREARPGSVDSRVR